MTDVGVISPVPAVRAGLRALLQAAGHRVAGDGSRPGGAAFDHSPDVIVLDAAPDAELGDVVAAAALAPGIVVLGPVAGGARLPAALAGQPFAVLPRDASAEQLAVAVNAVALGFTVLDAPAAAGWLPTGPPAPPNAARADRPGSDAAPAGTPALEPLTPREREVLQLVAEGLANKHVARRLGISDHTVKFHLGSVMAKLGAASRTEAVHVAARSGLVSL